jgi:hypothetical protein
MVAIISFGISALLLVALFGLRAIEIKRGRVFFAGVRDSADNLVLRAFLVARRGIVREVKQDAKNVLVNTLHSLTLFALSITRGIEGKLIAFISYMRRRAGRNKKVAEPSPFLKTVVEERKEEREAR